MIIITASCKKSFLEDMKSYDKYDESVFTNEVLTGQYIDRLIIIILQHIEARYKQKLPWGLMMIPKQKIQKRSVVQLVIG
jgi:hypothetical protein